MGLRTYAANPLRCKQALLCAANRHYYRIWTQPRTYLYSVREHCRNINRRRDNVMALEIIEHNLSWNGEPEKRSRTECIVLHHLASEKASLLDVHNRHLSAGWSGIVYHFYIRKDGSIHRGRPEDSIGAHALGYNPCSIGICFEGSFEAEDMTETQKTAGRELISYLVVKYDLRSIFLHSDISPDLCPGANFPFKELTGTP